MRVFAVPASLLLVTAAAVGCERVAPTTPEGAVLSAAFQPGPGFAAEVVAEGLAFPQGAVQLGHGVLFVTASDGLPVALSQVREIIRVLPSGEKNTFAVLPPTGTVVDLVFDPVRGLFASTIPGTGDPQPTIWNVRPSGEVTQYAAVAQAPTFLAFDPEGRLVVNQAVGDVVRIEADRSLTTLVDANPANTRLRGIAFDATGRLYVLANESPLGKTTVRRFDLAAAASLPVMLENGIIVTDALPFPPPIRPVQDLQFWPRAGGDLFTVDAEQIYRIRSDGAVAVFASGLAAGDRTFNALSLTQNGDLLVTEYTGGRVTRIRALP